MIFIQILMYVYGSATHWELLKIIEAMIYQIISHKRWQIPEIMYQYTNMSYAWLIEHTSM